MITRSEVIRRALTIWPLGTVPYSQATIHQPDRYRQDCSGYVSMCWQIPLDSPGSWGGMNTVSLVERRWMYEIPAADLKPGDAVGNCGPGTAGDAGHIVLFERWYNDDPNDDRFWCLEQAGGQRGPVRRVITYPYPSMIAPPWKAYRYRDITDTPTPPTPPTPGGTMNELERTSENGDRWGAATVEDRPEATILVRDAAGNAVPKQVPNALRARLVAMAQDIKAIRDANPTPIELTDADIVAIADQVADRIGGTLAAAVADEFARRLNLPRA